MTTNKPLADDRVAATQIALALVEAAHQIIAGYYDCDPDEVTGADRMAVLAMAVGLSLSATVAEDTSHDQMLRFSDEMVRYALRMGLKANTSALEQAPAAGHA